MEEKYCDKHYCEDCRQPNDVCFCSCHNPTESKGEGLAEQLHVWYLEACDGDGESRDAYYAGKPCEVCNGSGLTPIRN